MSTPTSKVCTRCDERKPLTEFHRQSAHWTRHTSRCKRCALEAAADRRQRAAAPARLAGEEARDRRHAAALALVGRVRARRIAAAVDQALKRGPSDSYRPLSAPPRS